MEEYKHFGHPHNLSFHKSLEGAELTCTGCNYPCTNTPIYSCHPCKFYLHKQCFESTRTLIHPLHPDHPLSLFPSPTYPSGSFICSLCNNIGSGLCFCCSTCEFDLHIHCAYNNDLNPKSRMLPPSPNQIQIKAHPNHPLHYLPKPPYDVSLTCSCDMCGTVCNSNDPLYHCDICSYDAHVECVNLPEKVKREDHAHELSLLHVNPYESFECDICKGVIAKKHCMYFCNLGCDYGMHITCVSASVKVPEKTTMNGIEFQVEMFKIHSQMLVNQTVLNSMAASGFHNYHRDRYSGI